jgi:hypothetical protein
MTAADGDTFVAKVSGPGSATDSALAAFDGTTGKLIKQAATVTIAQGGTGQTTANAAFNALAPSQASNTGKYLTTNGTDSSWATVVSGATISNDTSTATNLFPIFSDATSGTPTTVYTSNAKLLYKPSTGELQASAVIASNGLILNSATVAADYTVPTGSNALSSGPVAINSGITVTVSSGSIWTVV